MDKQEPSEKDDKEALEKKHKELKYIADPKQSYLRLDKFLMDKMEKVSRNKVQKAIKEGKIRVNGERIKSNYKIRPFDVVTVHLDKPRGLNDRVVPEDIPISVAYEDDDLLVVLKPPGLVVHPGIGNYSGTLVNAVAFYLKGQELPIKDKVYLDRPGIVHRIDKDTSGLLIIGKTEEAMTHLGKQFYKHTIEREYVALVWGDVKEDKGTIVGNIARNPADRMQFIVFPEGDQGKHAVTHYEVIERMYYVTLIRCRLETGRTHQIRVHMKYLGHTLFNDIRYGGNKILKGTVFTKYKQFVNNAFKVLPRHALHARSLGFTHPRTEEKVYLESELPEDFALCVDKWRKYVNTRKEVLVDEEEGENTGLDEDGNHPNSMK